VRRGFAAPLLIAGLLCARSASATELRFVRDGSEVHVADLATLLGECSATTIEVETPPDSARATRRACPFANVLRSVFGAELDQLAGADVTLRSWSGEDRNTTVARLREDGAYLAAGDAEADLVWTKPGQNNPTEYPRVSHLAEIEVDDFARRYPHLAPNGVPRTDPAWHGFELFRGECIACHSINAEGAAIGPDLNIPKSIVEYRPIEQIKAYIRDPATFRYGKMPAHPEFTDTDLDALIAYFRAMSQRKFDSGMRKQ